MASIYKLIFKFKNEKTLEFKVQSDEGDLLKSIATNWSQKIKEGFLLVGDYIISINDILWLSIEGERISEEPGGK